MAAMTDELAVELRAVRKQFDTQLAVDDVDLAIPSGSVFGLLGPNGAGKTTTIRMIMDILAPDRGEVRLFGRPRRPDDGARIGYLPEERGLYRKMTVEEQLVYLGELHGLARGRARELAAQWLARVELADRAKAKVETLSKGMQQKIQLAGTLLHDPELLILDEPFSGLDPINQTLFKDLIAEFRGRGRTILFSTHVMEHAEKLCDRIALIAKGRVVLAGELAEIKRERGGNLYRLVGSGPLAELSGLAGVESAIPAGESAVLLALADGVAPSAVLREAVARVEVREFRSEEPDLETIFVRTVRDAG
jgi:ABC-2 type transport system ATP-binding protein